MLESDKVPEVLLLEAKEDKEKELPLLLEDKDNHDEEDGDCDVIQKKMTPIKASAAVVIFNVIIASSMSSTSCHGTATKQELLVVIISLFACIV